MGREWKFENVGIDGTMFGVFYSLPIRRSTQSCQRDWVSRRFKGNELRSNHWTTNNVGIQLSPRFNLEFKIYKKKLTPRQLQMQWCAFSSLADLRQTPAEGRRPRHTHAHRYMYSLTPTQWLTNVIPPGPCTSSTTLSAFSFKRWKFCCIQLKKDTYYSITIAQIFHFHHGDMSKTYRIKKWKWFYLQKLLDKKS